MFFSGFSSEKFDLGKAQPQKGRKRNDIPKETVREFCKQEKIKPLKSKDPFKFHIPKKSFLIFEDLNPRLDVFQKW